MALGDALRGQQQQPIQPALVQSMQPSSVASQAQPQANGGIGALMQRLQENPAAIQMLLQTGAQLLNPTTFQSPSGRVAQAISDGNAGYSGMVSAAEDKAYQKSMMGKENARENRKVDLTEQQLNQQGEQFQQEMGLKESQLDSENNQFLQQYGLDASQLAAQKDLWAAQAERYRADATRLAAKAKAGNAADLTGPERIQNNIAKILSNAGMGEGQAYMTAFDIYNKSGEARANAVAGTYESLGMLGNTPKGKELLNGIVEQIDAVFKSGASILEETQRANPQAGQGGQEVAPNVTQQDIQAAIDATNKNSGTNYSWDQLNRVQQDQLIKQIQNYKGNAGG